MNMEKLIVGIIAGLMLLSEAMAQTKTPIDVSVPELQSDLAWCFGAALAQNKLHQHILEEVSELAEDERPLAETLLPAAPSPINIYMARRQLASLTAPLDSKIEQTRYKEGKAYWHQDHDTALERLVFYGEKQLPFLAGQPNCSLRYGQTIAPIIRHKKTKLDGKATLLPAILTAMPVAISERFDVLMAREFLKNMLSSGGIDEAEKDLLREIMMGSKVEVSSGTQMQIFAAADQRARRLISFFVAPSDLKELWLTHSELTLIFADVSLVSPRTKEAFVNFVARQLLEPAQDSRLSNLYQPLKTALAEIEAMSEQVETPETAKRVRRLAFLAMRKIDKAANDQLPDSLYSRFQK